MSHRLIIFLIRIEAITLHWHGIHQTDNYWMDGAAYINQCPIPGLICL